MSTDKPTCTCPSGDGSLRWPCAVHPQEAAPTAPATRSQRLADAGFTARDKRIECDECGTKVSAQMLPVHKCEPAHDTCLILWKAMNEAEKYGQRTDDKLIVKFLREAGYVIATAAPAPAQDALTEAQVEQMFRRRKAQPVEGEKDPWYWYAWGVEDAEAAHGIKEKP
jgi:hypothetical protein